MKTVYQTIDGKVFETEHEALSWETKLKQADADEFQDLVNRLIIVMERSGLFTDEDFRAKGDFLSDAYANEGFQFELLSKLKLVKDLDFDTTNYYDSTCW